VTLFRQFGTKEHLIEAVVGSAFGPAERAKAGPAPVVRSLRADLDSFAAATRRSSSRTFRSSGR
jgi:hypothetical protein